MASLWRLYSRRNSIHITLSIHGRKATAISQLPDLPAGVEYWQSGKTPPAVIFLLEDSKNFALLRS
jgi:hypothetical protein